MNPNPFADILADLPFFVLVAVRILALLMTAPLFSMQAVPRAVHFALAGLTAFLLLPTAYRTGWVPEPFSLFFLLLVIGEALLGVLTGLFVNLIFSAFSAAGQFFSYQMGFGASEVYDALAQVENPLMGQYFNMIAVLVFLQTDGFQKLFLSGVMNSVRSVNCFSLIQSEEAVVPYLIHGLGTLFFQAALISLPVIGTLFLVHVTMGLLSKAAPQMNLLSEGFPATILLTFFLLALLLPRMINLFAAILDQGFAAFQRLLAGMGGAL